MRLTLNKSAEGIDPKELAKGVEVEKEHFQDNRLRDVIEDGGSNDDAAEAVAEVHLEESPDYYKFLSEMEKEMKKDNGGKESFHNLSLRGNKLGGVALESVKINNMKFLLWSIVKGLDKIPIVGEDNESIAPMEKKILKHQIGQDMSKFHELYNQVFGGLNE